MAGAISVNQAIINTDMALRSQLPAIATIIIDQNAHEEHLDQTGEFLTIEVRPSTIRELGTLPYVQAYDYSAWGLSFFSISLERFFDASLFLDIGMPEADISDAGSLSHWHETLLEQFTLKGVQYPGILDINAGLIELVDGRPFTEEEVNTLSYVAVVSQNFLEVNDLSIGSILTLEYIIYDETAELTFGVPSRDENILISKTFDLEIVGAFDRELEDILDPIDVLHHLELVNLIYVPNLVIESVVDLYLEVLPEIDPALYSELSSAEQLEDILNYDSVLFLLDDPTDLVAFAEAANEILPRFWVIEDLSNAYEVISNSMVLMN